MRREVSCRLEATIVAPPTSSSRSRWQRLRRRRDPVGDLQRPVRHAGRARGRARDAPARGAGPPARSAHRHLRSDRQRARPRSRPWTASTCCGTSGRAGTASRIASPTSPARSSGASTVASCSTRCRAGWSPHRVRLRLEPTDRRRRRHLAGRPRRLLSRLPAPCAIALLRACDTPARMVAVYAPGLEPMDFHAVVKAYVRERWLVVDATALAPRRGLVRIATGRRAADTAFLSATERNGGALGVSVATIIVGVTRRRPHCSASTLGMRLALLGRRSHRASTLPPHPPKGQPIAPPLDLVHSTNRNAIRRRPHGYQLRCLEPEGHDGGHRWSPELISTAAAVRDHSPPLGERLRTSYSLGAGPARLPRSREHLARDQRRAEADRPLRHARCAAGRSWTSSAWRARRSPGRTR